MSNLDFSKVKFVLDGVQDELHLTLKALLTFQLETRVST